MKNSLIKKIISFLLISCCIFSATSCRTKYDCFTCRDEGIIDCPNCHVKKCDYKVTSAYFIDFNRYCLNGYIYIGCDNCMMESYIDEKLCPTCDGDGYDKSGYRCKTCDGDRWVKVDCPKCNSDGYYKLTRHTDCENGYLGGTPCADKNCTLPNSTSKNDGYTYIDCPDCEKNN